MLIRRSTILLAVGAFLSFARVGITQDLSPWTDPDKIYGNEWIDYSKKYVRVGVTLDGVYSVSLANLNAKANGANFTKDNVQIWHRGREVTPLRVTETEVVFYGLKNDGASDGLMYRPGPEARLDKFTSIYSHTGAYFFTTATSPARPEVVNGTPLSGTPKETYHIATIKKIADTVDVQQRRFFTGTGSTNQKALLFTNSPIYNGTEGLHQSYLDETRSLGITIQGDGSNSQSNHGNGIIFPKGLDESFVFENLATQSGVNPTLDFLVVGNSRIVNRVRVSVSATSGAEQVITESNLPYYSNINLKNVPLSEGVHYTSSGSGKIAFKVLNNDEGSIVGVSYYLLKYPQLLTLGNKSVKTFEIDKSDTGLRNITVSNAQDASIIADISNLYRARIVSSAANVSGSKSFDINKTLTQPLKVLMVKESGIKSLGASSISSVNFQPNRSITKHSSPTINGRLNPLAYDYLIITHPNTQSTLYGMNGNAPVVIQGAQEYAEYRGSVDGGDFNTLLMTTRDIYDQFNYGEPSPVAIRRFVDFMLSGGVRAKHNLLLVGTSTAGWLINTGVELENEVPSWGHPASDALLVSELHNSPYLNKDVPAIPFGRLNAFNVTQVRNYLNKVKAYEYASKNSTKEDLAWRRKMVNVSGPKETGEVTSFNNIFNEANTRLVTSEGYPWEILATLQANPGSTPTPGVLHNYVNPGIGAVNFFGHGNQGTTQYLIYDPTNVSYTATNSGAKYPYMFITGCGFGNIYTSRTSTSLASNWLVTADKGAIVLVANTYKAYVSTASKFMKDMFSKLYGVSDASRKTIGMSFIEVAKQDLEGTGNSRVSYDLYTVANIHQTNIIGDPAMSILGVVPSVALPVGFSKAVVTHGENNSALISWETAWEKNSELFIIERSIDGRKFEKIGEMKSVNPKEGGAKYTFTDLTPFAGINYYRIKQMDFDQTEDDGYATISKVLSIEFESSIDLFVYPNPSKDFMRIKLKENDKIISWTLFNTLGNVVLEGNNDQIDLKNLSVGTYMIELNSQSGIQRRSIIKN